MNGDFFKRKEFLATTAVILVNLLILILGVWFFTSRIIETSGQLGEKQATISGTYKDWTQLGQGQKNLEEIKPNLERINQSFVSLKQPIEFIQTLEDLAKKSNILYKINLVSLAAGENQKTTSNILPLEINISGSFSSLMHFLVYLENMKYYATTDSIQISAVTSSSLPAEQNWTEEELKTVGAIDVHSVINLSAFTR